jgi:CheY-like chemotaxis protein
MSVALVVDDEPTICRLIATVLRSNGWETMTAPDAETALDLLEERTPDVVITDIRLPGANGVELAERIKSDERFSDVPLAFISAWESPPKFREPPPVTYFRKPFDVDALATWANSVRRSDGG